VKRPLEVRVECYSGYKADERPLRFILAEQCYEVAEVLDQWYGPGYVCFRLRADDGNVYILRHTSRGQEDHWTLEAFRRR
jgi:hypothetical protein